MKRLVLFTAVLLVFAMSSSFAQAPKRVLFEEFTSSTCPPCAATDPFVKQFCTDYIDKIVALKWHVNWPAPGNDPMYAVFTGSVTRSTTYYANIYAPMDFFNGTVYDMLKSTNLVADLKTQVDNAATTASPFTIDIMSQKIVGDSVITNITVKSVGALPTQTDLRLGFVIGERFIAYTGTNGSPSHDYVVRTTVPALASSGAIGTSVAYPAFSITQGGTNNYRFAAKIDPSWNRQQLFSAAFIQSLGTKEVFQANWNALDITLEPVGASTVTVGNGDMLPFKLTNNSKITQNLIIGVNLKGVPTAWNVQTDLPGGAITLKAGESKQFNITAATGITAKRFYPFSVIASTTDSIGAAGAIGNVIGKDSKDIFINAALLSSAKVNQIGASLVKLGYDTLSVDPVTFIQAFPDWGHFRTILYVSGDYVQLFSTSYWPNNFVNLNTYLTNGGHFLLCSDGLVGYWFNIATQYSNDAYNQPFRDNFHIEPQAFSQSSFAEIHGIPGDPVGNAINSTVAGLTLTQPLASSDNGGIPIFLDENIDTVGMRSLIGDAGGKSMYLSFGLDQVKSTDRDLLIKRIMDWFNGVASVKTSSQATAIKIFNYPNPVSKNTTFNYSLTERGLVNLAIYDVLGRQVSRLVSNEMEDQGTYTADFDVSHLSNGSYTYILTIGGNKVSGTMTVTK